MLPMLRNRVLTPGLVDEFFGKDFLSNVFESRRGFSVPAVNIIEGKDDFSIEVAAPGLEKDDFRIDLENNILTISCEKEEKREENDVQYMRKEFNYSSFNRTFSLPDSVDSDKIKASHKNGILNITIPKKEEAKQKPAKQIKIN
jgi:HSP20 family protein